MTDDQEKFYKELGNKLRENGGFITGYTLINSKTGKVIAKPFDPKESFTIKITMENYAQVLSQDRVGKWFTFKHLRDGAPKEVSRKFHNLACELMAIEPCAERTVALRKLLEAKDAAVRATIEEQQNKSTQGWSE